MVSSRENVHTPFASIRKQVFPHMLFPTKQAFPVAAIHDHDMRVLAESLKDAEW